MTVVRTTALATANSYKSPRDFDYGVQDELRSALEQLRIQIGTRIRRAAKLDPTATSQDKVASEIAARIAEKG